MNEPTKKQSKDSVPPKRKFYTSDELADLLEAGMHKATQKIADEYKARQAKQVTSSQQTRTLEGYGENNKIFTKERADKARERLKKILS